MSDKEEFPGADGCFVLIAFVMYVTLQWVMIAALQDIARAIRNAN